MRYLKLISILLLVVGCNPREGTHELDEWLKDNGKVKVLSTTQMIGDLVKRVGGERVDSLNLIVGEIDPHSYELVKGDDEKLSYAQLIFYNGLGLEHGASLRYSLETHPNAVSLGKWIEKKNPDRIIRLGQQVDPHVWMDVSLWSQSVGAIVSALSQASPEFTAEFKQNGETLTEELQALDERIYTSLQTVPSSKRYLVTSHDAFHYFARRYLATKEELEAEGWRIRCAAPEGLAPDGQLSIADLQKILDYILLHQVDLLFPESNVSRASLQKIANAAEKNGLKVFLSSDPLYGDAPGPGSYQEMMSHNEDVLKKGWK